MQTFDKSLSVQSECNPAVNLTLIVQQGQTTVVGVHSHVNDIHVFVRGMRLDWFLLLVFLVQITKWYNFHMSCRGFVLGVEMISPKVEGFTARLN